MSRVKGRTCGSCAACCTAPAIPELNKPAGVPCQHLLPAQEGQVGRCGQYAASTKPKACDTFRCLWLEGAGTEEEKPVRSDLLYYLWPETSRMVGERDVVQVLEMSPGAFERRPEGFLRTWQEDHLVYLIVPGAEEKLLGPEERLDEVRARQDARRWVEEALRQPKAAPQVLGAPKARTPSGWGG